MGFLGSDYPNSFSFLLNCYVLFKKKKKLPQTLRLGYYFEFLLFQFVCSQFYSVIQLGNFSFSSSVRNSAMFLSF